MFMQDLMMPSCTMQYNMPVTFTMSYHCLVQFTQTVLKAPLLSFSMEWSYLFFIFVCLAVHVLLRKTQQSFILQNTILLPTTTNLLLAANTMFETKAPNRAFAEFLSASQSLNKVILFTFPLSEIYITVSMFCSTKILFLPLICLGKHLMTHSHYDLLLPIFLPLLLPLNTLAIYQIFLTFKRRMKMMLMKMKMKMKMIVTTSRLPR